MEKLVIKQFAGLKDIEIAVNKINIIIGPQASGKSIIAKLLFYFRSFIREIFRSGIEGDSKRSLDRKLENLFKSYFPADSWGENTFAVKYFLGDEFIAIERSQTQGSNSFRLNLTYSNLYKKTFEQVKLLVKKENQKMISDNSGMLPRLGSMDIDFKIQSSFAQWISARVNQSSIFEQVFIPAGRSFFSALKDSIFILLSKNTQIDPFLIQFGQYYERCKYFTSLGIYQSLTTKTVNSSINDVNHLKDRILVGEYISLKGEDYLQAEDGRRIKLSHCSSGQQEVLPLVLILESLLLDPSGLVGNSIYIEEPEAHLFPSAQRDIINLVATVYNSEPSRLQFFITTHSPYVLTAFNNLIQAGILSKDGHRDQVLEVMPASQILDPDDVAAYHVVDGKARNIIDPETQLIDAQIIDSISEELEIQFDQLLEIL